MDLNNNEKGVLKLLVADGRISDKYISKKLKISAQAVGKIRKRLENEGIIKGYCTEIDFKKLGINSFAIIYFDLLQGFWNKYNKEDYHHLVDKMPHMIFSASLLGADYNFVALEGFRSVQEMEEHINQTRINLMEFAKVVKIETFFIDSLIKWNPKHLIDFIISDKKIPALFCKV